MKAFILKYKGFFFKKLINNLAERQFKIMVRIIKSNRCKRRNINELREHFDTSIIVRGESVILKGEEKEILVLEKIFKELVSSGKQGNITQMILILF